MVVLCRQILPITGPKCVTLFFCNKGYPFNERDGYIYIFLKLEDINEVLMTLGKEAL